MLLVVSKPYLQILLLRDTYNVNLKIVIKYGWLILGIGLICLAIYDISKDLVNEPNFIKEMRIYYMSLVGIGMACLLHSYLIVKYNSKFVRYFGISISFALLIYSLWTMLIYLSEGALNIQMYTGVVVLLAVTGLSILTLYYYLHTKTNKVRLD